MANGLPHRRLVRLVGSRFRAGYPIFLHQRDCPSLTCCTQRSNFLLFLLFLPLVVLLVVFLFRPPRDRDFDLLLPVFLLLFWPSKLTNLSDTLSKARCVEAILPFIDSVSPLARALMASLRSCICLGVKHSDSVSWPCADSNKRLTDRLQVGVTFKPILNICRQTYSIAFFKIFNTENWSRDTKGNEEERRMTFVFSCKRQ